MNDVPYGCCHCGCGQKTKIAGKTQVHLGWKKGEPLFFIIGHNRKRVSGGKVETSFQKYPERFKDGHTVTDLPGEEWKAIPFCPKYSASNLGRIKNGERNTTISCCITKAGRVQTALYYRGKLKSFLVHRLVFESLNGPIPQGQDINHKDGNPQNNNLVNLEPCTRSDNLFHAYAHGLNSGRGELNRNSKLKSREVFLIKKLLKSGKWTQDSIAKMFRISSVTINHINTGRHWSEV